MREKLLAWTLVGLLLGVAGRVTATTAEVQTVEGMSAIVRHNQAAARTQAIHSALRKALEDTVAALLESSVPTAEQRTLETHFYAHSGDFIRSYRVLWEYPDTYQQVYRVQLEAEVAAREVAQTLWRLGLAQAGDSESEQVMVLVAEHRLERPQESVPGRDDGVVAGVLRAQLQAHGLRPVRPEVGAPWDGSLGSALATARQAGAELVLVGQADVRPLQRGVSGMSEHAVRATVWVQVLRTASGLEVATEQGEAITMHPDAMVGDAQALAQAAREVATRVLASLQRARQTPQDYSGSSYRPR
jgi:hypothetical protein